MPGADFERRKANGRIVWSLIGRAWADEEFKKSLVANPAEVLALNGVELPAGTAVKVLEETPEVNYLVIPAKPSDTELVDLNDEVAPDMCLSFAL